MLIFQIVFGPYSLAYAIKMAYKTTAIQNEFNDFTVFPLEGIWQKIEETVLVKENLGYTIYDTTARLYL